MRGNTNIFYHFIRDYLKRYSENVRFKGKLNPIEVYLNGNKYSVHISDIHFANRTNPDEYRIQITPEELEIHRLKQQQGYRVVFLGAFMSGKAFVGWEPNYVLSMRAEKRFSVYCRASQEEKALLGNAAVYEFRAQILKKKVRTIALPVDALGLYLENTQSFHDLLTEDSISNVIEQHQEAVASDVRGIEGVFDAGEDNNREKFTYTRKAYPRDPRFKNQVLAAYNRTCCICERQLSIIQAAHIIPHSEDDSPNSVTNGLALCIEHHRLYDDALLLPGPDRKLVFNDERAEYLRQTKQERGLDDIAAKHGTEFIVPDLTECQPSNDYLQRGLEIRLGQ